MSHKTVLVSGASGNLGRAVVDYFLNHNFQVVGIVHHPDKNGRADQNYTEVVIDLTRSSETENAVEKIVEKYQEIDIAVMTAGGFALGKIENTGIKEMEHQYQLNFATAYNLVKPVYKQMRKQAQGKLFFIGSEPGMDTRKGKAVVAYSLAKSLLFQLANIINAESKDSKIQAHVIVPGAIDTPENRKSVPKADFSQWQKPEAIAAIIGRYAQNFDCKKQAIVIKEEL